MTDKEHEQDTRLVKLEADMAWVKYMATAAAATGIANVLIGVKPAAAAAIAVLSFLGAMLADLIVHLR